MGKENASEKTFSCDLFTFHNDDDDEKEKCAGTIYQPNNDEYLSLLR